MKTRKFIDHAVVHVRAGKGGDGSGSFRREAFVPLGGPDGGDGGRGGHVFFRGSHDVDSLIDLYFAPQLFAENGVSGSGRKKHGRNGDDLVVAVPCGTEVYDNETGLLVADIVSDGSSIMVARAGQGGLGNIHFKTSTHQAPKEHTPGGAGEEFCLRLELKSIADAGLLGFPNAGKSSLLKCISDAHPRVAGYPFTTLNPIVGTIEYDDFSQLKVADIPGIIEGAASGVGLGMRFLRHIVRSSVLVYVIDMAGVDDRQPWEDYLKLLSEIRQHDASLLDRPFVVLANKMDLNSAQENLPRFISETGLSPIPVSTLDGGDDGIERLKNALHDILEPLPRGSWRSVSSHNPADAKAPLEDEEDGMIHEADLEDAPFLDLNPPKPVKRKRRGRRRS
ncbi:MAG: GTPase ObgE [Kiritimatiellia bacterium]